MPPQTRSSASKAAAGSSPKESNPSTALPVTVLSGFLGSGKTTLLRHILSSPTHKLRIAIIVNDMASINIDAAHIARFSPKDNTKLVQMQNGCICCTLRGDLLAELATLAWSGKFDHVVIESSGISEPQQVAETFTAELSERMEVAEGMGEEEREILKRVAKLGGLDKIAKLDTMVTVVDAFRFFSEFDTPEFLVDRFGREEVPEEDQRTVSDLFAEQIEFANVVVINKTDMVDRKTVNRIREYIKALNPHASILESKYSKVDIKKMLKTGQFNFGDAVASAGWLSSLQEMTLRQVGGQTRMAPKPETLEYGIGSFVYTARKPFDPLKLYKAIEGKFILLQDEYEDDEDDEDEEDEDEDEEDANMDDGVTDTAKEKEDSPMVDADEDEYDNSSTTSSSTSHNMDSDGAPAHDRSVSPATSRCSSHSEAESKPKAQETNSRTPDQKAQDQAILVSKRSCPLFRGVHRSKGAIWFATRPSQMGGWSSAGAMLTINYQAPWFCTIPEEEWGADEETTKSIKLDFRGEWGDRRQELVFIGEDLDKEGLTKLLDDCLLSDKDMARWEKIMRSQRRSDEEKEERLQRMWDDGFWTEWAVGQEHDHDHAGHEKDHRH